MPSAVNFSEFPAGAGVEYMAFSAADGAGCAGFLYSRGGERGVICITHPRGGLERHYMIPAMLDAGFAVFTFHQRLRTDDFDLVEEVMLLDIAGAVRTMKESRGYETVLLFGNSGGGGPLGYYQWQAEAAPGARMTDTPAGDPLDLNAFEMPAADGLMLLAAGFGECEHILRWIDPSVIDEDDPIACDAALDMYDPANGYREPPESSSYSEEFRQRYRAAQRDRVARIDARARALIADQRRWRAEMQAPGFAGLPLADRLYIERRALDSRAMRTYRLTAALENADLSIYPSKRTTGSFLTPNTHVTNYMTHGTLGGSRTPRAWLSASSGLSSRCTLKKSLPNIRVPTLVIGYTGDAGIYPQDVEEMRDISAASDKALHQVDGTHFGLPLEGSAERAPRETVGRLMREWMRARFC
jgi:hypothetical protein